MPDETGKLVHNENIYPHPPRNEYKQAAAKVTNMVATYDIQAIAIGNGTAGRETEKFIQTYASTGRSRCLSSVRVGLPFIQPLKLPGKNFRNTM